MEQILLEAMLRHMKQTEETEYNLPDFTKGMSCLSKLVAFYDGIAALMDKGEPLTSIWISVMAFDTVHTNILLERRRFDGWMDCSMDKELVVRSYPGSSDQWLSVWVEISDEWHPSGFSTRTNL